MDKLNKICISANNYVDSSGNAVVLENYIDCDSEKNRLNQDCKKSFESKNPLRSSSADFKIHVAHVAKNTKARAYVCFICKARYSNKDDCRQHMLSHREKNGTYTNETAYQETTQKVDSRKSTPIKPMEIEDKPGDRCKNDIASVERTNIKGRQENVNGRRRMTFNCGTCRSTFQYYHQLVKHSQIGSCNKVIENKSALIEHKRLIHTKSKYVCSLCLFCQITFTSELRVSKHMSQHHSGILIQILTQQEPKLLESITSMFYSSNSTDNSSTIRYNCMLCGLGGSIEICVREHILENHSNKVLDRVEQQYKSLKLLVRMFYSSPPSSLDITCYLCGEICNNKYEFKQHLISHTEEEQCCNECGRHLEAAKIMCINIIAHEKSLVHEFSKILKCPICKSGICCEKCFKTHLSKKHSTFKLTPASAKNFLRCDVCATSFSNMDDQKKHMATHRNKKLFLCIGCGITFLTVGKMKAHKMTCINMKISRADSYELTNPDFNGQYVFSCHECPKTFAAKSDLELHLIMHKNAATTSLKDLSDIILKHSAKEHEENHDLDSYLDLSPQTKTAKISLKTEQYDIAVPGDQVSINVKQEIDDGILGTIPFVKQEVLDDDGVNVDVGTIQMHSLKRLLTL